MKSIKLPRNMMYLGEEVRLDPATSKKRTKTFGIATDINTGEYYLIDKVTGAMINYKKYYKYVPKGVQKMSQESYIKRITEGPTFGELEKSLRERKPELEKN